MTNLTFVLQISIDDRPGVPPQVQMDSLVSAIRRQVPGCRSVVALGRRSTMFMPPRQMSLLDGAETFPY